MQSFEIVALVVSAVGVACFAVIFTILYRNYAHTSVTEIETGQRDVELIERVIMSNFKDSQKWHKVFTKTKQILAFVLIAIMVPFLILSIMSKIQNGVVMLFDKGVIAVASGSMSEKHKDNTYLTDINNQFMTYDLIVLEKLDDEIELQKYDVIAYVNDEGVNIIHRIIGIEYTADGLRYVTRGDSNNASDKYKPSFDDIIGRYTDQRIPLVGLFAMFLQSYSGIVTIAAVIYCLLMIEGIGEKINRRENARLKMLAESIDFERESVIGENELESTFIEKVRYKGHIYIFDENGFVSKAEIPSQTSAPLENQSDGA